MIVFFQHLYASVNYCNTFFDKCNNRYVFNISLVANILTIMGRL